MNNTSIKDLLKRGEINKVAQIAGFSRQYVSEYLQNPGEWKGSGLAAKKIIDAIDTVVTARKKEEEKAQSRLAKLLNETEKVA